MSAEGESLRVTRQEPRLTLSDLLRDGELLRLATNLDEDFSKDVLDGIAAHREPLDVYGMRGFIHHVLFRFTLNADPYGMTNR